KAEGTELMAIIGAIREFIEVEEERLRKEREESYRQSQQKERERAQGLFRMGADCGWIPMDDTKAFFCRKNGRAYRIEPTKERRWRLFRLPHSDGEGFALGTYQNRGEANKALKAIAYEPEPRW